jgi:autotransporter passenger strand-loop-strand repeat protein
MTTFTIQSGQTSTLVLNSGDVCVVQSGGTALDTIVNNGAVLRVSGGVASGALVNNGGVETIADGSDIGTTVNSGGLYITRRPFGKLITISDTVFNSGGSGEVTDAANVTSVQVRNGASLTLQSLVADVTVSGLFIESGGSVAASQLVRKLSLQGVEVGGLLRLLRDQGDAPIPLSGAVVFSSGGRLEDDFIPRHGGFVDPVSGIVRNPVSAAFAAAVISGLTVGATLDLAGVPWEGNISATLLPNNVLHIVEGSGILDLQLDPSQDFTGKSFKLSYLQSPNRGIPSGGTRVTLVSGSISQQQVSSLLIIGSGESSDGLAVDSGGSVGVNSGGSAADVVLDTSAILSLNFGAFASGVFDGGGLVLVGPGATLVGVTASGGGILNASAGAVIVGAHIIGDGAESVFGTDSAGFIDSGGTQSVSSGGSAVDTVVAAGDSRSFRAVAPAQT